ncbi:hypothetical protein BDR22DRAFT_823574 [Usnea florida]
METLLVFKSSPNSLFSFSSPPGMPSSNLSSIFSRLVPVSRSPTAQLTTQLRYRETPAEYRPTSTNQSRDSLDQQRTMELGDEMRAVQSIYTACVRDQTLSSTVQDLYRLVTTLAAEAIPESDEHLSSSIEKANVVRTIDRFVRETTSEYGTALRELSSRTHDARLFRFHAHLGDYAGALFLFAIRSYARRNFVAHGEIFDLYQSKEFAGLANYLENDEKLLEDVLPDEEKPMAGNWRRLLTFFRDIRIRQTSDGVWERQTPLSVRALSPQTLKDKRRLAQAVLRSEIEMGRKRESDSPDGPPPQNVKFDPGSLRRRSFSVRKSTKRYAMGQPPGATSAKKAKGIFYNPDLEDVEASTKDSDAWGAAKLQVDLCTFGAKLASASPSVAVKVFDLQLKQLEERLAWVKGKIEKDRNERAKKSRPKGRKEEALDLSVEPDDMLDGMFKEQISSIDSNMKIQFPTKRSINTPWGTGTPVLFSAHIACI